MQNSAILAAVIVIIAAVGLYLLYSAGSGNSTQATSTANQQTQYTTVSGHTDQTPVVMTDPPYAPAGTSAEVITYSSVMVHTTGPNGGWVDAQGSGSLNFATTTSSASQVMGSAYLAANATVDMVQYHIDSAYVVVNGQNRPVTVTNPTVTANVSGSGSVNSGSAILVATTPTIVATYNQNATSYSMQSSARAVVSANSGVSSNANAGSTVSLSGSASSQLAASGPSISITGASITTVNNVTSVSVSVKNNGNSSVVLNNVLIYGQQNASASGSGSLLGLNISIGAGLSAELVNATTSNELAFTTSGNVPLSVETNSSAMASSGTTVNSSYTTTLNYTGEVTYDSGHVKDRLSSGSQYLIVVTGSSGAAASTSVTAT